jgi:sRNA-binding carbon storage regulator CsrA
MLVLSLKEGQSVTVGNATITYMKTLNRHKIKLGFEAPREIEIRRLPIEAAVAITADATEAAEDPIE